MEKETTSLMMTEMSHVCKSVGEIILLWVLYISDAYWILGIRVLDSCVCVQFSSSFSDGYPVDLWGALW